MKTKSTTQTLTRTEAKRLLASGTLSRVEELMLRMHHGITVPSDEPLDMLGGGDPGLQARLAAVEKATLEDIEQQGSPERRNRTRERIVDSLKKLR